MHYVKYLLLTLLSFNVIADSEKTDYLFKQFNDKSAQCLKLTNRQIGNFKDHYYESLSEPQQKALLLMLSEHTLNRCSSYEASEYLKHIIVINDEDKIQFISKLYNKDLQSESLKILYKSLDQNEINRLLKLDVFSTPFDVIKLSEKLNDNED